MFNYYNLWRKKGNFNLFFLHCNTLNIAWMHTPRKISWAQWALWFVWWNPVSHSVSFSVSPCYVVEWSLSMCKHAKRLLFQVAFPGCIFNCKNLWASLWNAKSREGNQIHILTLTESRNRETEEPHFLITKVFWVTKLSGREGNDYVSVFMCLYCVAICSCTWKNQTDS